MPRHIAISKSDWQGQALSLLPLQSIPADVDECVSQSPCDSNALCTNILGSYTCACNDGYTGDGRTCTGEYFFPITLILQEMLACTKFGRFAMKALLVSNLADSTSITTDDVTKNGNVGGSLAMVSCHSSSILSDLSSFHFRVLSL